MHFCACDPYEGKKPKSRSGDAGPNAEGADWQQTIQPPEVQQQNAATAKYEREIGILNPGPFWLFLAKMLDTQQKKRQEMRCFWGNSSLSLLYWFYPTCRIHSVPTVPEVLIHPFARKKSTTKKKNSSFRNIVVYTTTKLCFCFQNVFLCIANTKGKNHML